MDAFSPKRTKCSKSNAAFAVTTGSLGYLIRRSARAVMPG